MYYSLAGRPNLIQAKDIICSVPRTRDPGILAFTTPRTDRQSISPCLAVLHFTLLLLDILSRPIRFSPVVFR